MAVEAPLEEDVDEGGGNGAANSGFAGNVVPPEGANGSRADAAPLAEGPIGGGVGLGVVTGVVAVEGRGLKGGEESQ